MSRIEQAVLGCLLMQPDLLKEADGLSLEARHFYHLPHQHIYRSIVSLWAAGSAVDLVTVEDDLRKKNLTAEIGGANTLTELFDVIPTAASFKHYVVKLFEAHREHKREMVVETALSMIREGNQQGADYLLQQALEIADTGRKTDTLPVESFAEMQHDLSIPPLVEGFLDTETVNILYGPSNSGKSFVALDLAFSVATGRAWAHRRTLQGGVVYVAAESPGSIRRRVMALRTVYPGIDHRSVPLWMIPVPVNLVTDDTGVASLIRTVNNVQRRHDVRLVIVDTLACTMAGGDENSFEAMGALAERLGRVRTECKTAVLGVHHSGKDQDRGARGHSSLRAAVDTELEIRVDEGVRSLSITKARDGVLGTRVTFDLEPVSIGRDSLGTEVLVPTVTYHATAELKMPTGRPLEVLQAGVAAMEAKDSRMITFSEWLESFKADEDACRGLSPGSIKRAFTRALATLVPGIFTSSPSGYYLTKSGVTLVTRNLVPNPPQGTTVLSPTFLPTQHARGHSGDTISSQGTPWGQPGDSARLSPPEMAGDNIPPLFRGGDVSPTGDTAPSVDLEEEEARARIESLRPRTG